MPKNIYHKLFLLTKTPTCILTPDGCISEFNKAYARLFNVCSRLERGLFFYDCMNYQLARNFLEIISQGDNFQQEVQLRKNDGSNLYLDIFAYGVFDNDNRLEAIIAIARDKTLSRKSDDQLIRFRKMLDQSNDAIFIIDERNGHLLDVNETACRQLGYSRSELLHRSVLDITPRLDSDEDWLKRSQDLRAKSNHIFESVHLTKNGSLFPVEISIQYIDEKYRQAFIAVARDISDRKNAERENKKSQEQWQRTFDSSTDIITVQNLKHEVIQCNATAARTFNLSREECLGKTCYELFSGINKPCPDCPINDVDIQFEPFTDEVYHSNLDKTFSIKVVPIHDDAGNLSEIAHFATDISQQKKLEEQLRHAQKMESLGTLAGGIAHDFNNILSAIMGYNQLAQAYLPQGSKALSALQQVTKGGQRATELVKQILTFSRKTEYSLAPVKIQTIVAEALDLLRPSLPASIEIRRDIDPRCPPVLADSVQIHQVIMNICTNAYQAMQKDESGTLELDLKEIPADASPIAPEPKRRTVHLSISDSGKGMDSATCERIFEPYFTTKKQGEGTGLGLAVAHGIIQDFGGTITVDSEPGRGARFDIYLPAVDANADCQSQKNVSGQVPGGKEHLLVVDDEEPISTLIKMMLKSYGYRVTDTTDSVAALDIFRHNPDSFDLLLTDLVMPRMNGLTLVDEIKKINPALPVILCTGFSDIGDGADILARGVTTCLRKPVEAEELALAVRNVLDKNSTPRPESV